MTFFEREQDTLRFHIALFRCFLLHLPDAPAQLSHRPDWVWTILSQDLGFSLGLDERAHDYDPVSRPLARCPPRRRYTSAAMWPGPPSAPMDQIVSVPPFFESPLHDHIDTNMDVNLTHGHDEPMTVWSAATIIEPGADKDSLIIGGAGVAGYLLLWAFALAMVFLRRWIITGPRSDDRSVCPYPGWPANSMIDMGQHSIIRPLRGDFILSEATRDLIADGRELAGCRASMPGGWSHEQNTFDACEEFVLDTMSWSLFYSCAQVEIKGWTHFSVLLSVFGVSNRGPYDAMTIGRQLGNARLSGSIRHNIGSSTPAERNQVERSSTTPDDSPFASSFSKSSIALCNRRCGLSAMNDVAVKDPDLPPARMRPDVICRDPIMSMLTLMESSQTSHGSHAEDMSSGGNKSTNKDGSDGELFSVGTRCANDVVGNATGFSHSLRQTRSAGHLWRKRDVSDDDDATGDDSYWAEQVNAELFGGQDFLEAPSRSRWSDGHSWPRGGREDETDNWCVRSSLATRVDKLRRYSSPPLSANAALSHCASGDGTQGIYVVPQKRGARHWSPVSSPQRCDRLTGLGFFPYRKTPALLTREAWRPGCLYIPDPPVDEVSKEEVWWDHVTHGSATASAGTETETEVCGVQGSRHVREGGVSWRDRYENDPASRRIMSSHRRATTKG